MSLDIYVQRNVDFVLYGMASLIFAIFVWGIYILAVELYEDVAASTTCAEFMIDNEYRTSVWYFYIAFVLNLPAAVFYAHMARESVRFPPK